MHTYLKPMKRNTTQDLIERPVVQIAMLLHPYLFSLQSLETCKGISTDAILHMQGRRSRSGRGGHGRPTFWANFIYLFIFQPAGN